MYLNVAAAYRIGPGPSSSQTVGPLEAARRFAAIAPILQAQEVIHGIIHGTGPVAGAGARSSDRKRT